MTYFENLVNSIDDENPFKMDLIMNARKMLRRAYELEDNSLRFFIQSENAGNKTDDEMY